MEVLCKRQKNVYVSVVCLIPAPVSALVLAAAFLAFSFLFSFLLRGTPLGRIRPSISRGVPSGVGFFVRDALSLVRVSWDPAGDPAAALPTLSSSATMAFFLPLVAVTAAALMVSVSVVLARRD